MLKNRGKHAFILMIVVGIVYLAAVTYIGAPLQYQLGVVVLMLFYVFAIHKTPNHTAEQIDSIYYLGFVFTIASLLTSLLPMSWSEEPLSATTVLGAFSVALSTTLIGIIFKLILGQLEFGGQEADLAANLVKFNQTVQKLTGSLEIVSDEIERGSIKTEAAHTQSLERMLKASEDSCAGFSISVVDSFEKISKASAEGYVNFTNATADAIKAHQIQAKNQLVELAAEIRIVNGSIASSYDSAAEAIAEHRVQAKEQLTLLSGDLKVVHGSISEAYKSSSEAISEHRNHAREQLGQLSNELAVHNESLVESYKAISDSNEIAVMSAQNHNDLMETVRTSLKTSLEATQDELNRGIDFSPIRGVISDAANEVKASFDVVSNMLNHSELVSQQMESLLKSLEQAVTSFDMLGESTSKLSGIDGRELSESITAQINDAARRIKNMGDQFDTEVSSYQSKLGERLSEATKLNVELVRVVNDSSQAVIKHLAGAKNSR